MGIEIGGLLGLIILVADVWAIVKIVGSSASTGAKGVLDRSDSYSPGSGTDYLARCRTTAG